MPNQHEHATRTFRPDICLEYAPAQETLSAAGIDMNRFLRACLRWLVADTTTVLAGLEPFLPPQPTKGRQKPPEGRSDVEGFEHTIGPSSDSRVT